MPHGRALRALSESVAGLLLTLASQTTPSTSPWRQSQLQKGTTDLKMLSLEVSHALGRDSAKRRMELLIQRWERKYGLRSSWAGDTARLSGTILGISLQATLEVNDQSVRGEANDPGILFRHKAKKYLEEKLGLYLDPSKTPEGLEQGNS